MFFEKNNPVLTRSGSGLKQGDPGAKRLQGYWTQPQRPGEELGSEPLLLLIVRMVLVSEVY